MRIAHVDPGCLKLRCRYAGSLVMGAILLSDCSNGANCVGMRSLIYTRLMALVYGCGEIGGGLRTTSRDHSVSVNRGGGAICAVGQSSTVSSAGHAHTHTEMIFLSAWALWDSVVGTDCRRGVVGEAARQFPIKGPDASLSVSPFAVAATAEASTSQMHQHWIGTSPRVTCREHDTIRRGSNGHGGANSFTTRCCCYAASSPEATASELAGCSLTCP